MIEEVLGEIRDSIQNMNDSQVRVELATDSFNQIAWIGEQLYDINKTLEKLVKILEAKQ